MESGFTVSMLRPRLFRFLLLAATCAFAQAPQPVGEVFASDASIKGAVTLTGSGASVLSGSAVTAGEAAARLRLARGGEVRICPRTAITVVTSASGRDLMLSMSTGALEAQYALPASADTIITPDFRIMLPGPGNFHFALSAGAHGDTCLRTLKYNTAALIVTELMGDAAYQVKPNEEVLFRGGQISDHLTGAGECGCPAAPLPVIRAEAPKPPPVRTEASLTAAPPPVQPNEVHVEVDAPFVFRGDQPLPELDLALPIAHLRRTSLPIFAPAVLPPPAPPVAEAAPPPPLPAPPPAKPKRSFFGKIGAFF